MLSRVAPIPNMLLDEYDRRWAVFRNKNGSCPDPKEDERCAGRPDLVRAVAADRRLA
jgi:hypothetical protein